MARIQDDASRDAVSGAKIVMEKTIQQMQKALKRYGDIHGPWNTNGEVFAFRPQTQVSYPAPAVVDLIRGQGHVPDFSASASNLKRMLKTIPNLKEDLAPMKQAKTSMRFGHSSVKAGAREGGESDEASEE
jgi:hypothetical protein